MERWMRKELDQALCEKYPLIFRDRAGNPTDTLMCWGFDVQDGWYGIIDSACAVIQSHIDHSVRSNAWTIEHNRKIDEDPSYRDHRGQSYEKRSVPDVVEQVVAIQIKEKFGTLRFYCVGGDDYTQGVLDLAERMSGVTCERCGAPGETRNGGWIRTLCDQHHVADGLGASKEFLP
jgi:hypothetical protein